MVLFLALFSSLIWILVLFTFKSKPVTPPAKIESSDYQMSVKEEVKAMAQNKGFILSVLANAIIIGYYFVISTALPEILDIYGYTPE